MESPVPTSPSSLATSSTPLSFKTPTRSPAPTLPVSTPSPAPLQYPEPPDEFVQDNITYFNREKTTKKAARLGSSHIWKYGLATSETVIRKKCITATSVQPESTSKSYLLSMARLE
ncbi:hypothetical protein BFJ68_g16357 [Fusarium oxysporum]|uniref:Uncharacterized protein n=1 Tax=Fusarium oxysporum TaxID=5507 RepID=A0A420PE95_FUSOX|nr:hypothetical protein BFJ68_g16357 [Fusarium oxysporum]